jgi:predicted  nucleic acid-binding Zn ribbon protein
MERKKNIHVLSLELSKWKENKNIRVLFSDLIKWQENKPSMCRLQTEVNGKRDIHVLSSDLSKWKENIHVSEVNGKTSMFLHT